MMTQIISVTRHAMGNFKMKFGYVVNDMNLAMQLKAVRDFGCDEVVSDNLAALIARLSFGDKLVVWRIDKLASSAADLELVFDSVHRSGASIELLYEKLNSSADYKEVLSQLIAVMKNIEKL
ncbi:hypothetical protein CGT94_10750 [Vibrio metoecus]|nr:hypothetical protein CGT94_10750 [Vibrio metoecus]